MIAKWLSTSLCVVALMPALGVASQKAPVEPPPRAAADPVDARRRSGGVNFEVVPLKAVYVAGERIQLRVALSNRGTDPLWINARMSSCPAGVPTPLCEVKIEVTDERGQSPPYSCKDKRGFAEPDDYQVLGPGETFEVPDALRCYVLPPGRYVIRAEYADGSLTRPPAPRSTKHLSEKVVAPSASFRVSKR